MPCLMSIEEARESIKVWNIQYEDIIEEKGDDLLDYIIFYEPMFESNYNDYNHPPFGQYLKNIYESALRAWNIYPKEFEKPKGGDWFKGNLIQ